MIIDQLKIVFSKFNDSTEIESYQELASGHINDTYLIKTTENTYFILQKINQGVFKDVPGLINNKVNVSKHIQEKFSHLSESERSRKVLSFIETLKGESFFYGKSGGYWNMMVYITDSVTHETVKNEEVAYEGGKLLGDFLNLTSDFEATKLTEVIPKFHDIPFRYSQYYEALEGASTERIILAKHIIDKVETLKEEMHILQKLKESGEVKTRVTHNDTKISNILFDKNNKGLCVIDLDTVMPGIVHYDFGDAIRTICNTAAEDEKDLDLVNFNFSYYKAYVKGFLDKMQSSLSLVDIKNLPLAAKTMIFIIGLRFITDYLNGDIYFKTAYDEHNLNRAKNQFKLIESLSEKFEEMQVSNL